MKAWFHKHFPDYAALPKSGKVLAWLTLLQGLYWVMVLLWFWLISILPLMWYSALVTGCIAALTLWTAWRIFRKPISDMRWALLVYASALIQFGTASGAFWHFAGLLNLSFGWGSFDGSFFNINFAVLVLMLLAMKNIVFLKKQIHAANPDIPENQI